MALQKDIALDNGIVLNYHRVICITNITNQNTIIEVASYVNEEQRLKEQQWYENEDRGDMNVFINTSVHSKAYDKDLNVDKAYEYLKTLDKFEDAEDC